MKKLLILFFLITYFIGYGQISPTNIEAGWGSLDYAVPEAPAFKILGTSPTNVMRPTSVRSLAINVGDYLTSGNAGTLPKNAAIEISPLLLNPKLDLKEYNDNLGWYRSRLSAGTWVRDNGEYDISVGLSFTLQDESDLRDTKNGFVTSLQGLNLRAKQILDSLIRAYALKTVTPVLKVELDYNSRTNPTFNEIDAKYKEVITSQKTYTTEKVEFEKKNWNASITQLGVAGNITSRDSVIENVGKKFRYGGWLSSTFRHGDKGQFLLGAYAGGQTDTVGKFKTPTLSLGLRYYYGSNAAKGFLEAEFKSANDWQSYVTARGGAELRLNPGLWLDVGFSYQVTKDEVKFVPTFSFKYAIPDSD